jgi:hypothetical protein
LDGAQNLEQVHSRFEKTHLATKGQELKFKDVLGALAQAHALIDVGQQEIDPYLPQQFRERLLWQTTTQDLLRPEANSGALEMKIRKSAYVAINGADPLALATAHLFGLAGVNRIVLDSPEHLTHKITPQTLVGLGPGWSRIGEPAILATREMLTELDCEVTRPRGLAQPDCEIFSGWPSATERDRVHGLNTPYLVVESLGVSATVGPLVLPGESPCVRCVEISNTRIDPYWPNVTSQVAAKPNGATEGLVDPVVVAWAASMAVMSVLALLANTTKSYGSSSLIGRRSLVHGHGPEMRQVTLELEPTCGCAKR